MGKILLIVIIGGILLKIILLTSIDLEIVKILILWIDERLILWLDFFANFLRVLIDLWFWSDLNLLIVIFLYSLIFNFSLWFHLVSRLVYDKLFEGAVISWG